MKTFVTENFGDPVTIETEDAPGYILDDPNRIVLDYLYSDDHFEMYVVYFAGDDPFNPPVFRVLGSLPWSWGGEVVYDPSLSPPYRKTLDFTVPGPRQGYSALNVQKPYQGVLLPEDLSYGPCPGGSEPPPEPPPDPCLNGSYYVCE